MIDHRASPGTAEVGEGQLFEAATITCSHCQAVVIISPTRTRPRGYCAKCDHYICDKIECHLRCAPFKAILEVVDHTAHHTQGVIIVPEQLSKVLEDPQSITVVPEKENTDG